MKGENPITKNRGKKLEENIPKQHATIKTRPTFKLFFKLTENKVFQNSKLVLGASVILVTQDINIMRDPQASKRVEVSHGYIIEKNVMKMKSHRRSYLAELDTSLSQLFLILKRERERERQERRDMDFVYAMTVECEGLRSERWRVRVEIGDGG